ncbi:Crp/Fnr family transcriptional regulator [uncultured Piscinibacter sp.]|uniref:Crp/Fnr family transcriptional regulator n=1 Tax=uncultured Piscinibacter sp. TaxID=1131835 RepID=UPI002613D412|nr:Crp/Fnr family transcriptional regulator [uncultured Piscinibacter sp.]
MTDSFDARRNRLLAAFTEDEWARCQPQMALIELRAGQVLSRAGLPSAHLYFPTSAIVSLLYVTCDGAPLEVAQVGGEGIVGVSAFLGGSSTTSSAEVRSAGRAWRIRAADLQQEFDRAGSAMHLLLRYTQALITQMAQIAVCARHHSIEQQLTRWMLLTLDRWPGEELRMTQELMAGRLGVRRESVTEAARHLQAAGLITYSRGHMHVLDRPGLERRSCECYRVIRGDYDRLLPRLPVPPPVAAGRQPEVRERSLLLQAR